MSTFGRAARRRLERAPGRLVEWCVIVAVLLWGERPHVARARELPRGRIDMAEIKLRPDVGGGIPLYVWVVAVVIAVAVAGWIVLA